MFFDKLTLNCALPTTQCLGILPQTSVFRWRIIEQRDRNIRTGDNKSHYE